MFCVNEGWTIIDLPIGTHNFYCERKDSFAESDGELLSGAPNRGQEPVWLLSQLDVDSKENPQEWLRWKT